MEHNINVNLKIWRQRGPKEPGAFQTYRVENVSTGSSFLEMLDMLNQQLVDRNEEPVVFDSDCREGICGMCSLYINGHPHGPVQGITTCQLHMRKFNNEDTITIEPWRSAAFPVIAAGRRLGRPGQTAGGGRGAGQHPEQARQLHELHLRLGWGLLPF